MTTDESDPPILPIRPLEPHRWPQDRETFAELSAMGRRIERGIALSIDAERRRREGFRSGFLCGVTLSGAIVSALVVAVATWFATH